MDQVLVARCFAGRNVFVAGGSSGINLGIAEAFAEAGATVAILSRSKDKIAAAVAQLKTYGGEAFGFSADVRRYEEVAAAFTETAARVGAIDVLISGAAGNFPAPAMGMSPNGFRTVIDIDLMGTYHVMRAAHPHLRRPGASVINIGAPQASQAFLLQSHVCAAKAGVDMLTRCLAVEWGPEGIRVNSLVPGPIDDTEGMSRLAPTEEDRAMVVGAVPLGRLGHKRDVADVALFLASPLARYVTGVVLPVDGGMILSGPDAFNKTAARVYAAAAPRPS